MSELKTSSCLFSQLYVTILGPLYLVIALLFSKVYLTGATLFVSYGLFFPTIKKDYFLFDGNLSLRPSLVALHAQLYFIGDKRFKWVLR